MSISSARAVSMMIGTERARAHLAAHLEAVDLREHEVEHDQVEVRLAQAVERLAPVERGHHLVALLAQGKGEQRLKRLLVVHQEDAGGLRSHSINGAWR